MSNSGVASSDRKDACPSTQEGRRLIEQLQNLLVRKDEEIDALREQVRALKTEKNAVVGGIKSHNDMKWKNAETQTETVFQCSTAASQSDIPKIEMQSLEESNCGESRDSSILRTTGVETQEAKLKVDSQKGARAEVAFAVTSRNFEIADEIDGKTTVVNKEGSASSSYGKGSAVSPQKSSRRTGSHVKRQNSKGRVDSSYQLSPDLQAVTVDLLANKYGGREKANNAARVIQDHYRQMVLSRSFKRVRAYSEKRKKSFTQLPEYPFHVAKKLSQPSIYDIENPVLIVDLDDEDSKNSSTYLQTKDNSETEVKAKERSNSFLKTMNRGRPIADEKGTAGNDGRMILLSSDSVFYQGTPRESKTERELRLGSSVPDDSTLKQDVHDEQKDRRESREAHNKICRTESADSYEVIDAQQYLHVISLSNDDHKTESLSSLSSEIIDEANESRDQSASIFYDDEYYPPTVDKSKKWKYRIGINLFNSKPEDGIGYLVDNGLLQNTPEAIADFLRKETSIAKQKISEYFGNFRKEMNREALKKFALSFDFSNKEVDDALRQFQSYFKLTGEAQSIERFLQVFSERYVASNPKGISQNVDTILLLSFAMAMLNTDLHNGNVKRKMTVDDFIRNLRGTDDGQDFPQEMLHGIFSRIQKNEFSTGGDHMTQLKQIEQSFIGKIPALAEPHRQFMKLFTLEEVYDPNRRDKPHFRLAFLFNDLLLLAKSRSKPGPQGSGHFFSMKASYRLLGMQVAEFTNEHYKFGVYLQTKMDSRTIGRFNLMDEKSRKSFTEELDDCIRETTGMNNIRILLSKSKQTTRNNHLVPQSVTLDRKKLKGKGRAVETQSLLNVDMNSLEDDTLSKSRASSMLNISEAASDTESEPVMRRSTSSTSLDNSCTVPKHSSLPRINESGRGSLPALQRKFTWFGFSRRRKHSADTESHNLRERRREVGMSTFFHDIDDGTCSEV